MSPKAAPKYTVKDFARQKSEIKSFEMLASGYLRRAREASAVVTVRKYYLGQQAKDYVATVYDNASNPAVDPEVAADARAAVGLLEQDDQRKAQGIQTARSQNDRLKQGTDGGTN